MAKLTINIGQSANDKNGDPLRTAFSKVNANFTELYAGAANETQLTNGSYTVTLGSDGVLTLPGILKIDDGIQEKFQVLTGATATVTHDCSLGQIFYHTTPAANWTANFTNLNLSTTYATAVTLIIVQGGTGYYPNVVQIGGVAQTIKWQGNTNPTPSTSRTDVVTFSIINNSSTYIVLGQLTGF